MATYVIGDVQGCYESLRSLLDKIQFDPDHDTLWFCGDLVNRGPQSLEVLRFVKSLDSRAVTVLGNHDLHLLAIWSGSTQLSPGQSLKSVLDAPDCDVLMNWLRCQSLLHVDHSLNWTMVHAALLPQWTLQSAQRFALEVGTRLSGNDYKSYFDGMYGDKPDRWHDDLAGNDRLRCITNVMTRLRYLTSAGSMALDHNRAPLGENATLTPWFQYGPICSTNNGMRLVFGHWSTLPTGEYGRVFAIDAGCLWGGSLVALRIDESTPVWYHQDCPQVQNPHS